MFAAVPLLVLPAAIYNLILLALPGGLGAAAAAAELARPLVRLPLPSGGLWPVNLGDLLVAAALAALFVELLKSPGGRMAVIVNRALSVATAVVCLMEFLLLKGFATSAFFLIALMAVLDVLAGLVAALAGGRAGEPL